jgi:tetratricopeptide (TPR) repeat protein
MTGKIAALQRLAIDAEKSGDLETALQSLREVSSKTDSAVDACDLGRVATAMGRWPEAEAAFLHALEISPGFSVAMLMIASLFLKRADGDKVGNLRVAVTWLLRSLEIEQLAPSLSLLATAYYRLGEKAAAKTAWSAALKLDNAYEEAYFNLGLLAVEEQNEAQAERLLRTATSLDPTFLRAHGRLGALLKAQGRYQEAEAEFRRCLEIDPSDYFSHSHLADTLAAQTNATEAEHEYRTALSIRPNDVHAAAKLVNYLERLSRKTEADEIRSKHVDRAEPA